MSGPPHRFFLVTCSLAAGCLTPPTTPPIAGATSLRDRDAEATVASGPSPSGSRDAEPGEFVKHFYLPNESATEADDYVRKHGKCRPRKRSANTVDAGESATPLAHGVSKQDAAARQAGDLPPLVIQHVIRQEYG